MKPVYHYTAAYLLNPTHPVTINLVGCGGTGSQVLNNLARTHLALRALGHRGFHVTAWDGDEVSDANIGRQLFVRGDIGVNKALALITRINRFYTLGWTAHSRYWKDPEREQHANITISCVDNVRTRRMVLEGLVKQDKATLKYKDRRVDDPHIPFYWLDCGNNKDKGQIILGNVRPIPQPKPTKEFTTQENLPNLFDIFPDMERHEGKESGPSCSLAQALHKQDLFINSTLAQFATHLIWKMFRNARLQYHGVFLNLDTMQTNPLKVKA